MNKEELIQYIGNEVCEGCGPDRDCGLELEECERFLNAKDVLEAFIIKEKLSE